MTVRSSFFFVGAATLAISIGCSKGAGIPKTVTVTGTVLYNGNPLQGAEVSFQPKAGGTASRPARGTTDSSGRFTLKTYVRPGTEADGAIPGDYLIAVTKTDGAAMTPEDMAKGAKGGKMMATPKNQLPPRYANAEKSGFTATVSADGNNDFKFELKD